MGGEFLVCRLDFQHRMIHRIVIIPVGIIKIVEIRQ